MSPQAALPFPQALAKTNPRPDARPPSIERDSVHELAPLSSGFSDEELLEAVGKGDKSALAVLFRKHGRSVLNVARRILHEDSEADDLRQDVFVYLFERAELYDAKKCSAVSWIMQITYHRAFNRRKFLNLRQGNGVEVFDEQQIERSVLQPSTDHIDGKDILHRLREKLSPEQRKTLELHFFEGYTFREIAEQSGQTIGNVRHHYYRALDTLRSHLSPKKDGKSERIGGYFTPQKESSR